MTKKTIKLSEVIKRLNLRVVCGKDCIDSEVTSGYVSDLLSDVMAHANKGAVWVTLQVHPNIIAVAVLKELSGIIIVNKRQPEVETRKKADAEKIPVMTSERNAFDVVGELHDYGISGT